MPDTSLGITYPASTGHPRMWEHMQEMANDVNGLLLKRPVIQSGELSVSFTLKNSDTRTIVFPEPFTAVPRVFCNINSSAGASARWEVRGTAVSTTQFVMFLYYASDGSTTFTWPAIPVQWIAVAP